MSELEAKLPSPPSLAVIVWLPTDRAEVANVADPTLRVAVSRVVAPSLNVTVPEGVPAPGLFAVTVAVKVTNWPKSDGLADETTAVAVASLWTVWVNEGDTLPVKFASLA